MEMRTQEALERFFVHLRKRREHKVLPRLIARRDSLQEHLNIYDSNPAVYYERIGNDREELERELRRLDSLIAEFREDLGLLVAVK
jgi:hypothetical protein